MLEKGDYAKSAHEESCKVPHQTSQEASDRRTDTRVDDTCKRIKDNDLQICTWNFCTLNHLLPMKKPKHTTYPTEIDTVNGNSSHLDATKSVKLPARLRTIYDDSNQNQVLPQQSYLYPQSGKTKIFSMNS